MDDLQFRIAQLNALLEPGYRGVIPAEESAWTSPSAVQHVQEDNPQGLGGRVLDVRGKLRGKVEKAGFTERLDQAQDFSERFDNVVRFVDNYVIPASFERLNERWTVPDTLTQNAQELKEAMSALETATTSPRLSQALPPEQLKRLRNETDGLGELKSTIDSTLTALRGIRFAPPEDEDWWWSTQGKGEERVSMAADAKATVQRVGGCRSRRSWG